MNTDQKKPTASSVLKLASQLNSKSRLKVISELMATLGEEQLEDLRLEVEQAITLQSFVEEKPFAEEIKKHRKTEIKYINGKAYAYLRWRDRSGPDQYLGPMPLMPGKTYRLTHKTQGTVKVINVLALEIDEQEQLSLVVQQIKPYPATKRYLYPDCIKQIFSKKEWQIELLGRTEAQNSSASDPVRSQTPATPTPKNARQLSALAPQVIKTKAKVRSRLTVETKRVAQVLKSLELWATLSQALSWTPQWRFVRYPHKVILHNQQGEAVIEYNRATHTVETAQPVPDLLSGLQEILGAVTQSPLVAQHQQSLARRLLLRLQQAPYQGSSELLAYLLDLPVPKQSL